MNCFIHEEGCPCNQNNYDDLEDNEEFCYICGGIKK